MEELQLLRIPVKKHKVGLLKAEKRDVRVETVRSAYTFWLVILYFTGHCLSLSVYDIPEAVEFAFKEWEDVLERRQTDLNVLFDSVYADVDAVVDLPHSYFFDAFLQRWPQAKVNAARIKMRIKREIDEHQVASLLLFKDRKLSVFPFFDKHSFFLGYFR